jgi:hypothetical protein
MSYTTYKNDDDWGMVYGIVLPYITKISLVGGVPTHLKNMSSSMGRIIPYIMLNKICLKPPTRTCIGLVRIVACPRIWD